MRSPSRDGYWAEIGEAQRKDAYHRSYYAQKESEAKKREDESDSDDSSSSSSDDDDDCTIF